ncbi:MAG TPA: hypothetical protein VIF33_09145 [Casimicrobiaceae bacterium]
MRRTGLSLDEEIAEVEVRLASHRARLKLIAAEARSRVSVKNSVPVAVVAAVAVGFAASRFTRKSARPAPVQRGSRTAQMVGAIAAILLPPLVRPLQNAAAAWFTQRMQRRAAR